MADKKAGGVTERLRSTRAGEALDLRRRVRRLEVEVQECRALNVRLAELTDIVTELLLPVAAVQQGNRGPRAGREGMQQGPGAGRGAGSDRAPAGSVPGSRPALQR